MTDKVKALIERAMSTDSEPEALACLRKAKKHWTGFPTATAQQPRQSSGVTVAQYNQAVRAYQTTKAALDKANIENAALRRGTLRATRSNIPNGAAYELAILKLKKQVEEQRTAKVVRTWFFVAVIFLMIVL